MLYISLCFKGNFFLILAKIHKRGNQKRKTKSHVNACCPCVCVSVSLSVQSCKSSGLYIFNQNFFDIRSLCLKISYDQIFLKEFFPFLISVHLFVSSCKCFHMYKFLPDFYKYPVQLFLHLYACVIIVASAFSGGTLTA